MNPKVKEIAKHYGYDAQSRQLIEEMAELTQAINKFWRKRTGKDLVPESTQELLSMPEYHQISSEMADVYIMLEQIRYLLRIDDTKLQQDIDYKVERTLKRMNEHD